MSAAGQCKINPPTGLAGTIYTAWTGDGDAGFASGITTSGSRLRKILGAQIEAIAASIAGVAPFLTVSSQTASFSAAVGNHYRVDCTTGNIVVLLPSGSGAGPGSILSVKRIDGSGNSIQLLRSGGDLIDGATTLSLAAQWSAVQLVVVSGGYDVIGKV